MADFYETETPNAVTDWQGEGLPEGVRLSGVALLGALVVCGIPYGFDELERFRVWTPEDPIPFAGKFQTDGVGPVVAEAGGHLGGNRGLDEAALAALSSTSTPEGEELVETPAPLVILEPLTGTETGGDAQTEDDLPPPRPR